MTTTLLLARHGRTVWHAENRYGGVSDLVLTRVQVEVLGCGAAACLVDVLPSPVAAHARRCLGRNTGGS